MAAVMRKRFINAISSQGLLQVLRVIETNYLSLLYGYSSTRALIGC